MLKFTFFIFLTCEESVRIRLICEELVRFFSDVQNCHGTQFSQGPNPRMCEESVQTVKRNMCVEAAQSDDLRI